MLAKIPHTVHEQRQDDFHQFSVWILVVLMYVVLFATLYLIWWKANPLWWA